MKLSTTFIIGAFFTSCFILTSCLGEKLTTYSVTYQSIRTKHAQPTKLNPIPDDAKIAIAYYITEDGELTAIVYNRTAEIMTIDQTKSFFVNSDGTSTSYYDPTVRTTSTTNLASQTTGGSINLGSVASAFGIGGTIGTMAGGINLGGSGTTGVSTTNTTYIADLPQVSLSPNSNGAMSKVFKIQGIGLRSAGSVPSCLSSNLTNEQSYCRFSVCISYSIDGGETYEKIVTDFYANSKIIVPIKKEGRINEALRSLYTNKPDALNEYWWSLSLDDNTNKSEALQTFFWNRSWDEHMKHNNIVQGMLYDYQ